MRPPKNTTVIATPLANCWREGSVLYIDNLNCERTADSTTLHYQIISNIVRDAKLRWLKQFPECPPFPPVVRNLAAEVIPQRCEALAILAPSSGLSALRRSYDPIKMQGVPVAFFDDEKAARAWLDAWRS